MYQHCDNLPEAEFVCPWCPLAIILINPDGFLVGDPGRLDQMRRYAKSLMIKCDGLLIVESHVRKDTFSDPADWCQLNGWTLYYDFVKRDPNVVQEQQKAYRICAIFHNEAVQRDGLQRVIF